MKSSAVLILLWLGFLVLGCKPLENYPSNVELFEKKDSFTYSFVGQGYSKKVNDCQSEAEKNIFEVILFKGISGTDLQTPIVENEMESRKTKKEFFDNFFDNKAYRNFISSDVQIIDNPKPSKGGFSCKVKFTVNINSLKTNLEQNGVIRKFGL